MQAVCARARSRSQPCQSNAGQVFGRAGARARVRQGERSNVGARCASVISSKRASLKKAGGEKKGPRASLLPGLPNAAVAHNPITELGALLGPYVTGPGASSS
ncbi:hypothetical protein MRX96_037955 [Rhipicephalus microplus]